MMNELMMPIVNVFSEDCNHVFKNTQMFLRSMLLSNTLHSINEVVNSIIENYDIDTNSARNDLDFFLKDLTKNEIIFIDK